MSISFQQIPNSRATFAKPPSKLRAHLNNVADRALGVWKNAKIKLGADPDQKNYAEHMRVYDYPRCPTGVRSIFPRESFAQVFAIGDLHGDLEAARICLCELARVAKISHENGRAVYEWVAPERTAVIILGDLIDRRRGDYERGVGEIAFEEIEILNMVNSLAEQAGQNRGAVVRLVGNHEMNNIGLGISDEEMALHNARKYVTGFSLKTEFGANDAYHARYENFISEGKTYYSLLNACAPMALVQVGRWMFMHGGLNYRMLSTAAHHMPIIGAILGIEFATFQDYANYLTQFALAGHYRNFKNPDDQKKIRTALYNLFLASHSLVWDRKLAQADVPYDKEALKKCFMALDDLSIQENVDRVDRVVVAHCAQVERGRAETKSARFFGKIHLRVLEENDTRIVRGGTPQLSQARAHGINCSDDDRVWRIDVAMSRAFLTCTPEFCDESGCTLEECFEAVRPAVLRISFHDDGTEEMQTIVSTKDLKRNV